MDEYEKEVERHLLANGLAVRVTPSCFIISFFETEFRVGSAFGLNLEPIADFMDRVIQMGSVEKVTWVLCRHLVLAELAWRGRSEYS